MPHNQILVPLRTLGKGVQRSQRRMWKEWVKEDYLQAGGKGGGERHIPLPKHFGLVTGCLWDGSSKWGPIYHHWVWVDSR